MELNKRAIEAMNGTEDKDESLRLLREAEEMLQEQFEATMGMDDQATMISKSKLLSVTYNNFACYYK